MTRASLASVTLLACIVLFIGGCAWQQGSFSLTEALKPNNEADRSLPHAPRLNRRMSESLNRQEQAKLGSLLRLHAVQDGTEDVSGKDESNHKGGAEHEDAEHEAGNEAAEHEAGTEHKTAEHQSESGVESKDGKGAEHKSEQEEEESVWAASNLIAVMLFLFIFIVVLFVYLVFYRDPDVRKAVYTMLNSTMSIFIAVTINTAAFSFMLEQVIAGRGWGFLGLPWFPRGLSSLLVRCGFAGISLGVIGEFTVSVFLFTCSYVMLNRCIIWAGKDENLRGAIRVIGGHLMAFAGIITFSSLQSKAEKEPMLEKHHFWVVLISMVFVSTLRFVVGWFRDRELVTTASSEPGYEVMPTNEAHNLNDLHYEMKESLNEAENDACSLIFGFIIMQLAVWWSTGNLLPLHPSQHDSHPHTLAEVCSMLKLLGASLVPLVVLAFVDRVRCKSDDPDSPAPVRKDLSPLATIRSCSLLTCLMTASWLALITTTWEMERWLKTTPMGKKCAYEIAEVGTAFALTVVSVVLIMLLDHVADKAKHNSGSRARTKAIEVVARKLIEVVGILVGLCWEKACHGAMDTMIESTPELKAHQVISKVAVAAAVALCIFPAWYQYILPMASKEVEDHKAAIDLATIHLLHRKGELEDAVFWEKNPEKVTEIAETLKELKAMVIKIEAIPGMKTKMNSVVTVQES